MSERVAKNQEETPGGSEGTSIREPDADGTTFAVPADAKPITNEDVARALDGLLGGEPPPKR